MRKTILAGSMVSLMALSGSAFAEPMDFDFSGTFSNDNDVVLLDFSVGTDSTITIFSSSWLSGDSGLGFDPILAIWDSSGTLVRQQDDGGLTGSAMSNGVSYDYGVWDTYFETFLTAGSYTASIGQYDNFANSDMLADGFQHDDNPNFTFDLGYGPEDLFNGVFSDNDARTGDWEFHILDVDGASGPDPDPDPDPRPVSVPATIALFGMGLAGLGWSRRRKV